MKNGSLKNAAISVVFAEFAALIFLILSSVFSYNNENADDVTTILALLCHLTTVLICGVLSGFLNKENNISTPIITSLLFTSLQIASAIILSQNEFSATKTVIKSCLIASAVFFVSFLISSKRSGAKRRRKRRNVKRKR